MKKVVCTICLVAILLIAGCSPSFNREPWIEAGYNPNYIDGYEQGWFSGLVAAGYSYSRFQKDFNRYENDSKYKQGWNDGFVIGNRKKYFDLGLLR